MTLSSEPIACTHVRDPLLLTWYAAHPELRCARCHFAAHSGIMVALQLTRDDQALVRHHAEQACIGGVSHVRARAARLAALRGDQWVGMAGQLALHCWASPRDGRRRFDAARVAQNATPHRGDGGDDLPPHRINVKSSLRRTALPLTQHRLPVRPAELHIGMRYVLAIVEDARVTLLGWAPHDDFPAPTTTGAFAGAHVLPAQRLRPMRTLRLLGGVA